MQKCERMSEYGMTMGVNIGVSMYRSMGVRHGWCMDVRRGKSREDRQEVEEEDGKQRRREEEEERGAVGGGGEGVRRKEWGGWRQMERGQEERGRKEEEEGEDERGGEGRTHRVQLSSVIGVGP